MRTLSFHDTPASGVRDADDVGVTPAELTRKKQEVIFEGGQTSEGKKNAGSASETAILKSLLHAEHETSTVSS